jgi:magnesium transporter
VQRGVSSRGTDHLSLSPRSEVGSVDGRGGGAGFVGFAIDVHGLKRRGGGRRSWVRVDAATGASEVVEVAKPTKCSSCATPTTPGAGRGGGAVADESVRRYVNELQRRLVDFADDLSFEFITLEIVLKPACSFLDSQVRSEFPLLR